MPWLSTFTAGFSAVVAISLVRSFPTLSIKIFKLLSWLRSSGDEMSELFTGNVGSNGISLLQKVSGGPFSPHRPKDCSGHDLRCRVAPRSRCVARADRAHMHPQFGATRQA